MTRRVRVLHVLHELQASGAETCLRVAGDRWSTLGVAADVLATGPRLGPYAGRLHAAGYRVGHLPVDPFRRFAPRFLRLLRTEGYDAVHIHIERASFYVSLLARCTGARVVLSVHNTFGFDGALRLERTLQRALMRGLGMRFVSVTTAVQDNEANRFRNRTTVVRNWYDPEAFHVPTPEQRAEARVRWAVDGRFAVVSVGNCMGFKNHDAVLEAVAQVDTPDLCYLHAGTSPREEQERRLAASLGVEDRIRFLGSVDDVPSLLFAADCFVMPSLYEGLGVAAVEAMATGLPAVLADVPGLSTLREEGHDAWWIPPRPDALADAIEAIMAQSAAGTTDRDRARARRVAAAYGPDEPLVSFASLYGAG